MVDQLCSVADVKTRMLASGQAADAVDDTLLSALIDQVSAWVTGYTRRQFVAATGTYQFDTSASSNDRLLVPRGIQSITQFLVADSTQPDAGGSYAYAITTPTHVLLRPITFDRDEGWPATEIRIAAASPVRFVDAYNGAKITGTWGFAAVPSDIKGVTIDAVVIAYANRADGVSGAIGPDGVPVPSGISAGAWSVLNRYRDWPRGLA